MITMLTPNPNQHPNPPTLRAHPTPPHDSGPGTSHQSSEPSANTPTFTPLHGHTNIQHSRNIQRSQTYPRTHSNLLHSHIIVPTLTSPQFHTEVALLLNRLPTGRAPADAPPAGAISGLVMHATTRQEYITALQTTVDPALAKLVEQIQRLVVNLVEEVEKERGHWSVVKAQLLQGSSDGT